MYPFIRIIIHLWGFSLSVINIASLRLSTFYHSFLSFPFHFISFFPFLSFLSFCLLQSVSHSLSILRLPLYPPHVPAPYVSLFLLYSLSHIPNLLFSPLACVCPFSSPSVLFSPFTSLPCFSFHFPTSVPVSLFPTFFSVFLPLPATPPSALFSRF